MIKLQIVLFFFWKVYMFSFSLEPSTVLPHVWDNCVLEIVFIYLCRVSDYLIEYPDWRQTFPMRKPRIFERAPIPNGGWTRCEWAPYFDECKNPCNDKGLGFSLVRKGSEFEFVGRVFDSKLISKSMVIQQKKKVKRGCFLPLVLCNISKCANNNLKYATFIFYFTALGDCSGSVPMVCW